MVPVARRLPGGEPVSALAPSLSEQQRVAVEARGEVVVAAGAGTGKTTLVIARVRAALELGTPPERVLVVTYTEAAARELALRLERALPGRPDAARPQVGTIHALAARLLREYASQAGLPAELRVLDEAGGARALGGRLRRCDCARASRRRRRSVLDLLGEYGVDGSRALIRGLDARLRAAGAGAPLLPPAQAGPQLLAPLREAAASSRARSWPATIALRPPATSAGSRASRRCWRGRPRSRAPRARGAQERGRRGRGRPARRRAARGARPPRARGRARRSRPCWGAIARPTGRARTPSSHSTSTTSRSGPASCSSAPRSETRCASASISCSWTSSRTRTACSAGCWMHSWGPAASGCSWATRASPSTAFAMRTWSSSAHAGNAQRCACR